MKKENLVAKIIKIYAFVNQFGCIIAALIIGDDSYIHGAGWYFFFASLVVNFAIYAFGEIIQLLHDIKLNTMNRGRNNLSAPARQDPNLPDL